MLAPVNNKVEKKLEENEYFKDGINLRADQEVMSSFRQETAKL